MYFNTKQRRRRKRMILFASWAVMIASAILLAWGMVTYVVQTTYMTGESMKPTLKNGEMVFVHKLGYQWSDPKRFDIIVFENRKNNNSHFYIKRVIGLPNEIVQIQDGDVYINGEKLKGIPFKEKIVTAGLANEEMKLGEDEYFVMGDNANNSEDSRSANIGNVRRESVIGKINRN